ncbi:ATP-binding protein (plasmid) [Embleya sp. NBC_00888]|uniref:ATP-binding protein n=1 Tax=Embleya sp. NBC_00888 TaxID=2975960 RepID=UPI002F90983D|nr:ATP-binding protein [Embleya sp. NBC_00888]
MARFAGGGPVTPADRGHPAPIQGGAVFDAVPAEVPRARRVLVAALRRWHVHEDDVHSAQLVACELLSNAVRYGSGPTMDLDVRMDDAHIHLAVRNRHARPRRLARSNGSVTPIGWPEPAEAPEPSESVWGSECGRGLRLVEALAVEWGSRPLAGELLVWATIARVDGARST